MWYNILFTNAIALTVFAATVLMLLLTSRGRKVNVPPGPWGWPVVGSLPLLTGNIIETLEDLRKQYGDVYTLYLGNVRTVFVHGLDNITEVLVTRGDEFGDRPKFFITEKVTKGKGIACSSGEKWKHQRRFTLHTLRDFGFGRTSLEGKIQEEAQILLNCLKEKNGASFPIEWLINTSVSNVICSIIYGRRYAHDDPVGQKFLRTMTDYMRRVGVGPLNYLPWLQYLPGDLFEYKQSLRDVALIEKIIQDQIDEHKKSFDPNNLRDFIDGYLAEMAKQSGKDSAFEDEQLLKVVGDLFIAGSESTSNLLQWALLYLINKPDVQSKARSEILSVVGKSRLPSMSDRKHMPFLQAVIMETQRCADIGYLSFPHAPFKDTILKGYTIPKGTTILTVLTSLHKDPQVWINPETFDPNRFLDSDGKVIKSEYLLPFSAGKRVCPGESLVKMELFLFLSAMLQRFAFKHPEGVTSLSEEPIFGITRAPYPFYLRAVNY